jgi:hypothetical protein
MYTNNIESIRKNLERAMEQLEELERLAAKGTPEDEAEMRKRQSDMAKFASNIGHGAFKARESAENMFKNAMARITHSRRSRR